jgi:ASC-1-like (ASCH) protein
VSEICTKSGFCCNLEIMKTHTMKLHPEPYGKIKEGVKKMELRLYDEKRKGIEIGDEIIFLKEPKHDESITTKVIGLVLYASFSDLLDDFASDIYLGYNSKAEAMAVISQFYSIEEQSKNGVLGIRIEVCHPRVTLG